MMKKAVYCSLLFIAIISGCAKVTQEGAPCTGAVPVTPMVQNAVIPLGSYETIYATNYPAGAQAIFSGPNNFVTSNTTGQLFLDFSSNTNYGLYTAKYIVGSCISIPDTFYVLASFTGNPPCTISPVNYNTLNCSNGNSYVFSGGASLNPFSSNSCSGYSDYDISGQSTNGWSIDINIPLGSPAPGTYYQLISSCNLDNGYEQAYVTLSNGFGVVYQSVSGQVYFNTIAGQPFATFCGAVFSNTSGYGDFTVSGNIQY